MFRLAPVVLLASLSSVATAQAADLAMQKNPIKQAPDDGSADDGSADNAQPANGNVSEPDANMFAPSDYGPPPLGTAYLKMAFNGVMVEAHVHSSQPGFLGIVGLSLTPDLIYPFGMTPLLAGAMVMAFGATDTQDLGLRAPLSSLPAESITLFGQALVIDEKGLWSSNVVGLTIGGKYDGTEPAPANGSPVNADQALVPAAH